MRVFLCAFVDFSLAIPMHSVSSLALCSSHGFDGTADAQQKTVVYNRENQNTYISIPRLFNLPSENIRHCIVLKKNNEEDDDAAENRIILLIPGVECDTEIPDEEIYSIPKALSGTFFSALFSGIQVTDSPVLVLNTEQLILSVE